ncbi:MAG: 2,4-dihydroxyhept-2-ene-1,7-dioic acid aldolase [Silicimonas sp.]|nr:2,4-dihydroxyhept-2-ene-1,7-dioic acid aldolase [Silicimonas sp.]
MKNPLNVIWNRGEPVLNGWCSIANTFTAEIMAAQGYDSLTIDGQHGALDYSDALPMLQTISGTGKTPLARVPWREPGVIMKYLDAGALGIICPMINSSDEAAEFASYMRYPPLGQRSFGPTRAGFAYPGYNLTDANNEVLAFAMIETADGIRNLEDIAATKGIDGLYVGPNDLALGFSNGSLPSGLDREEPEVIEILQRIATTAKSKGIHAALHCGTVDYAMRGLEWGYDMVTVSGDARLLAAAASDTVNDIRTRIGGSVSDKTTGAY